MKRNTLIVICCVLAGVLFFSACDSAVLEKLRRTAKETAGVQADDGWQNKPDTVRTPSGATTAPAVSATVEVRPAHMPEPPAEAPTPELTPSPTSMPVPEKVEIDAAVDGSFVVELMANQSVDVDLDGDGVEETLVVRGPVESAIGEEQMRLELEDGTVLAAVMGGPGTSYLLRNAEGNTGFILSTSNPMNTMYSELYQFEGLHTVWQGSLPAYAQITVTETSKAEVSTWGDTLGSWGFTCTYTFTKSFKPQPVNDGWWQMEDTHGSRNPLVAKMEVPVQVLRDGKYVDYTLQPGEEVYLTETDTESVALFGLADGTPGRILFYKDAYRTMIGKFTDKECFDNIMYSG